MSRPHPPSICYRYNYRYIAPGNSRMTIHDGHSFKSIFIFLYNTTSIIYPQTTQKTGPTKNIPKASDFNDKA